MAGDQMNGFANNVRSIWARVSFGPPAYRTRTLSASTFRSGTIAAIATAMRVMPRGPNRLPATASPTKVCQRVDAWNSDVKLGPSMPKLRSSSGRVRSRAKLLSRMAQISAPPTPRSGTDERSARARVWMIHGGEEDEVGEALDPSP